MKTKVLPRWISRIKVLMREQDMNEASLARGVGVPQATINRILSGETRDPRINTLLMIAQELGVTVGYLVDGGSTHAVPVIAWHEVKAFVAGAFDERRHREWLMMTRPIAIGSFALKATPSMAPRYRAGATIVVEPLNAYLDGQVVIAGLGNDGPAICSFHQDGAEMSLRRLDEPVRANVKGVRLLAQSSILGAVTEARLSESV